MSIVDRIDDYIKRTNEATGDGMKYKEFFMNMLKKYKVNGVGQLTPEQKKKFFKEIEDKWTTEND